MTAQDLGLSSWRLRAWQEADIFGNGIPRLKACSTRGKGLLMIVRWMEKVKRAVIKVRRASAPWWGL